MNVNKKSLMPSCSSSHATNPNQHKTNYYRHCNYRTTSGHNQHHQHHRQLTHRSRPVIATCSINDNDEISNNISNNNSSTNRYTVSLKKPLGLVLEEDVANDQSELRHWNRPGLLNGHFHLHSHSQIDRYKVS